MTKEIWLSILLGVLFPTMVFRLVENYAESNEVITDVFIGDHQQISVSNRIPVLTEGGVVELMDMERYVLGVVLGEMPSDFHKEAIKAQAVAARTVACKGYYGSWKHVTACLCTNASCCQAYCPPETFQGSATVLEYVENAVKETSGQVILYNGELIEATYFSCSGGRTEDAVAVWGTQIPYLQAKDSPGEELAEHYSDSITISKAEFCEALGLKEGNPLQISSISYTGGGGVDQICISGEFFHGTQVRMRLNLRSTSFAITFDGDSVVIQTRGFGHRVGMSQYGAQAMANNGSMYQEILQYYYPGTELIVWNDNDQ